MREYKIKKGYRPNLDEILMKYFGVDGDIENGFSFNVDGLGEIFIQKKDNSLLIETKTSKPKSADYLVIKKWNDFLFEVTRKTAKERKKELSKL